MAAWNHGGPHLYNGAALEESGRRYYIESCTGQPANFHISANIKTLDDSYREGNASEMEMVAGDGEEWK